MIMTQKKVCLVGDDNSLLKEAITKVLLAKNDFTIENDLKKMNESIPTILLLSDKSSTINLAIDRIAMHQIKPMVLFIIQIEKNEESLIHDFLDLDRGKWVDFPIIEVTIDCISEMNIQSFTRMMEHYVINLPKKQAYIVERFTEARKSFPIIGVVGLGYVGLPVALGFAEKYQVIGFDVNTNRIDSLGRHIDTTGEVRSSDLEAAGIVFTADEQKLHACHFIIVAVPTPINEMKEPDLTYLVNASTIIGRNLTPNTIIVYESTVYPGTTEEVCIPILESESNLVAGDDFYVGYSPERINPGDAEHTFTTNNKVVSGQNEAVLEKIFEVYRSILTGEIYKAPSIRVAEASKVVENTQRDINIAFMNELSLIFNRLNIDTHDVLKAANTKWNFFPFTPGLVGGHCIGIDPYYLIYKAKNAGYNPTFLAAARAINDDMSDYIVQSLLKLVVSHKLTLTDLRITVLGITFKENIPDIRNSKALEIVTMLDKLGLSVQVCDPHVVPEQLVHPTNLQQLDRLDKADIVIFAVPHHAFQTQDSTFWNTLIKDKGGILMDIKGIVPRNVLRENIIYWSL